MKDAEMSAEAVVPTQTRPGNFTVPIAENLVPLSSVDVSVHQESPKVQVNINPIFLCYPKTKNERIRDYLYIQTSGTLSFVLQVCACFPQDSIQNVTD